MGRQWLRHDVAVRVVVEDSTGFGSPLSARPQEGMRSLCRPLLDHVGRNGFGDLVGAGPRILGQIVASEKFARVASLAGDGSWRVRPGVLYPDPARARLRWIGFVPPTGKPLKVSIPDPMWPAAHGLVAHLSGEGWDGGPDLPPATRQLLDGLRDHSLLTEAGAPDGVPAALAPCDLTFVGHNTVVVRSGTARVILDPLLFPADQSHPPSYQPLTLRQFAPVDAVLITHSHPDHFDPASLLQFPPDVPVIVPEVERETILTTAMAVRLQELGFSRVRPLRWGESTSVGDIDVHALPFYGEQPTDAEVLHPEVRNLGNTYVVTTPRLSAAFVADSGRDGLGDVKDVAATWCRDRGAVDIVFSGYRGWATFPVQLVFSSVAAFLLFVPRQSWGTRQRLMNDVVDAVDLAERWGARYLVPYADGGAPWHWEVGLGPRLDGSGVEDVDFDPYPDRVVSAARSRVQVPGGLTLASPVEVLLLRPGDSLRGGGDHIQRVRLPGHAWPYGGAGGRPEAAPV